MSSSGILVSHGPGRGITYAKRGTVFTAGVAVTAGMVYVLDETGDITSPNEPDTGALAVVRAVAAGDLDVSTKLVTFVLATESAALNGAFRGVVEQYGAVAEKTSAGSLGEAQTATAVTGVIANSPTIGNPIISYNLEAADPGQVHFNGTPGGFTYHPGT